MSSNTDPLGQEVEPAISPKHHSWTTWERDSKINYFANCTFLKDCTSFLSASCAQTQSCMQTPAQLHWYVHYQQSLLITAFLEVLHRPWRCSSFPMLSRNECERMCSLDLRLLFPQTIAVLRQSHPGCPLSPGHFAAAVEARNANPPTWSDNKHH